MPFTLPKHVNAVIWHNEHAAYYRTVAQEVAGGEHGYQADCWISEDQKRLAIERNECWTIQWYPDTPDGFHIKSAAELPALLDHINNL